MIWFWDIMKGTGGGDSTNPGTINVAKGVPYKINGTDYVGQLPPCCFGPVEGMVLNDELIGYVSADVDVVIGSIDGTCTGDIIGLVASEYENVVGLILNDGVNGLVSC